MPDTWTLALYGATGALGQQIRAGLEGEALDIRPLIPVAGVRSAGEDLRWRGDNVSVISAAEVDVDRVDVAIFACPTDLTARELPRLRAAGALVIDATGADLKDADAPLPVLWPLIADDGLETHQGGFALPCGPASTVAPILAAMDIAGFHVAEVDVVALAAALDIGNAGPEALSRQTVAQLSYQLVERGPFPDVMAFNAFAATAAEQQDADARLRRELSSLLGEGGPVTSLSVLRVPVFAGTGLALTLRLTDDTVTVEDVTRALASHPHLTVVSGMPSLRDAVDHDTVQVGPPMVDAERRLVRLFVAADPLHRVGAACGTLLARVLAEDLW